MSAPIQGEPIDDRDITFVFQGGLGGPFDVRYTAGYMKSLFPGAKFVLATQKSELKRLPDFTNFDRIVGAGDPGALPAIKFNGEPHNINRQIVSTAAGLDVVETPLAVKLRTDAYLSSRKILDYWGHWRSHGRGRAAKGGSRLLVPSLFTLNPRFDERLAFHVSDWLNFGETADLRRMWQCPLYDFGMATFYQRESFASGSLPREREFQSKFGTEQWLMLNYLYPDEAFPIRYHNDYSATILEKFEEELADNFIVVHPYDIDLQMPKHIRAYKSKYANLRNYSFDEWKQLVKRIRHVDGPLGGYSAWPRTDWEKSLYMILRRKRRMKKLERRY